MNTNNFRRNLERNIVSLKVNKNKMKNTSPKTERIFALDTLRAIMMLLGIVLHSAVTHASGLMPWPIKAPDHNLAFAILVDFIHLFRMPIFFVVSGFFAALLLFERGKRNMILNRIKRILFPFIVAMILIIPLVTLSGMFSYKIFEGEQVIFFSLLQDFFQRIISRVPSTAHLWFLYYLGMYCLVYWIFYSSLGRMTVVKGILNSSATFFSKIYSSIWLLIFFIVITFFAFLIMDTTSIKTSTSIIPDTGTFLMYLIFFGFGWALYGERKKLNRFQQNINLFLGISILLFGFRWLIYIEIFEQTLWTKYYLMAINSLITWMLIFGITGLFLKHLNKRSKWGRYVSDASYWIYLVHLPITLFLPGVFFQLGIPGYLSFILTMFITGILCTVSYDLFVRTGTIGLFLNGRKYTREIVKAPKQMVNVID